MPIIELKALRLKAKPLVYFHGTEKELRQLSIQKIAQAFNKSGFRVNALKPIHAKKLESFRNVILLYAEEAKSRGMKDRIATVETPVGVANFKITFHGDKLSIYQYPALHDLRSKTASSQRKTLEKILSKGFRGSQPPNVTVHENRKLAGLYERQNGLETITLELMAPQQKYGNPAKYLAPTMFRADEFIKRASPKQILRINVEIPANASETTAREIRNYYFSVQKKYKIPISINKREL